MAAERVYLQWNLVNWITVLLMAAVGVAAFGFASSIIRRRAGGGKAGPSSGGTPA